MTEHLTIKLSKVLHQRARLGIMSILIAASEAEFTYLKKQLNLTDGNLNTHLYALEREKFITIKKKFVKRKPKTICRLTERGRKALSEYIDNLEKIIQGIPK
jgi:DNA-binding MarR family transcriptional regulator